MQVICRKTFSGVLIGLLMLIPAPPIEGRQQGGPVENPKIQVSSGDINEDSSQAVADGLNQLAQRNYQAAAEILADAVARQQILVQHLKGKVEAAAELTRQTQLLRQAMVGAGSALRAAGRHGEALEFFESAIEIANTENEFANSQADYLATIKLAAAECAVGAGKHQNAMDFCDDIIAYFGDQNASRAETAGNDSPKILSKAHATWIRSALALSQPGRAWERFQIAVALEGTDYSAWQELALAIGLAALSGNEPAIAQLAFRWYQKHAIQLGPNLLIKRETALLGIAWAAAKGAEPYEVAATRLLDFADQFPESKDAAKALLVGGGCLERCGDTDRASSIYQSILTRFPGSSEAIQATGHVLRLTPEVELTETLLSVVRTAAGGGSVSPSMIEALALVAIHDRDETLWGKLLETIDTNPNCGAFLSKTLKRLVEDDLSADAERIAVHVLSSRRLSQNIDKETQDGSCPVEQTCRWAAAHGKWKMLSLAGKQVVDEQATQQFNTLTLRLMAEGAVQSTDLGTAKQLIHYLVTQRGNADFDTLLRKAEIALAIDTKEVAGQAIETADQAATSEHEHSLATILMAQWFIRDARMLEARDALQRVIRSTAVTNEVKARAEWLLGETYFLQRQFVEAINHYRLVEPLDTSGTWAASALLQAGRAFEQLGRQREAAVCYTGLMTRFGDSSHLQVAQQRLAALGSSGAATNGASSGPGRGEKLR